MRIRRSSFGGHLTAEPGAGEAQFMLDDVNRFTSCQSDLAGGHAAEVVHFDNLCVGVVFGGQGVEGFVHLKDPQAAGTVVAVDFDIGVPRDLASSTALGGSDGTGMVDQDLTHNARHEGQEVSASREVGRRVLEEANKGFVDQRGWLEGMAGWLVAKEGTSDSVQFAIDEGQELIDGGIVAGGQLLEEQGDAGGIRLRKIRHCSMILHRGSRTGNRLGTDLLKRE
jgi:hypothetical protein